MNIPVKPKDKVFYHSRYSGILPCEVIEVRSNKVQVFIDIYNKRLWVYPDKLLLQASWALQKA